MSSSVLTPSAKGSLFVNAIQFGTWLAQASTGDKLEYHRGLLAMDASDCSQSFEGHRRRELNRVARRAWWAAEEGLVHLVQRRNGPDNFSYLAIARLEAREIPQSLSSVLLKEVAS